MMFTSKREREARLILCAAAILYVTLPLPERTVPVNLELGRLRSPPYMR